MHDVFISYKSDDSALAMKVVKALEENGIPCWIAERDIRTGSNYAKDIPAAIRTAKCFILILTAKSQESPWVLKELDAAISQKKVILPLLFGVFQINDEMNFMISGVQYHDATKNLNKAINQIMQQIQEVNAIKQPEEILIPSKQTFPISEQILDKPKGFTKSFKKLMSNGAAPTPQEQKELFGENKEKSVGSPVMQERAILPTEKEAEEPSGVICSHCGSTNVTERGGESGCGSGFVIFFFVGLVFFLTLFFFVAIGWGDLAILISTVISILLFVLLVHHFSNPETYWFCNTCGRIFEPESEEKI